jgi:hypothetical protein
MTEHKLEDKHTNRQLDKQLHASRESTCVYYFIYLQVHSLLVVRVVYCVARHLVAVRREYIDVLLKLAARVRRGLAALVSVLGKANAGKVRAEVVVVVVVVVQDGLMTFVLLLPIQ